MADFITNRFTLISKPVNFNWSSFLNDLISSNYISTRAFYGDLHGDSEFPIIDRESQYKSNALNEIMTKINGYEGSQIVIFVKEIFRLINTLYGIDFLTNSTVFDNINPYIQLRYFKLKDTKIFDVGKRPKSV